MSSHLREDRHPFQSVKTHHSLRMLSGLILCALTSLLFHAQSSSAQTALLQMTLGPRFKASEKARTNPFKGKQAEPRWTSP
jgi:hypothetical protein